MVALLLEPAFGKISRTEVFRKLPVKLTNSELILYACMSIGYLTFLDELKFRIKASPLLKLFSGE